MSQFTSELNQWTAGQLPALTVYLYMYIQANPSNPTMTCKSGRPYRGSNSTNRTGNSAPPIVTTGLFNQGLSCQAESDKHTEVIKLVLR